MALPVSEEVQSLIKDYVSDKIGIHPTAQLIKKLIFIPTDHLSTVKIILAAYDETEYFILLRDSKLDWDYVRDYKLESLC